MGCVRSCPPMRESSLIPFEEVNASESRSSVFGRYRNSSTLPVLPAASFSSPVAKAINRLVLTHPRISVFFQDHSPILYPSPLHLHLLQARLSLRASHSRSSPPLNFHLHLPLSSLLNLPLFSYPLQRPNDLHRRPPLPDRRAYFFASSRDGRRRLV
jgi:hypothetical protein